MKNQKISLEQRAGNVNPKDFPKELLAYCEICKKDTTFIRFEFQLGYNIVPDDYLYNCAGGCRGTKAYETLMKRFNGRVIE